MPVFGEELCPWCLKYRRVFEDNHYPVPKSEGGKDTVRICIECHRMWHWQMVPIDCNGYVDQRRYALERMCRIGRQCFPGLEPIEFWHNHQMKFYLLGHWEKAA